MAELGTIAERLVDLKFPASVTASVAVRITDEQAETPSVLAECRRIAPIDAQKHGK